MSNYVSISSPMPIKKFRLCFCCGLPLDKGKKKYCSRGCREEFMFKLKWFNNLLRAVNTKYATFFFTEDVLVLNILPFDSWDVYSYFFKRTPGKRPVYDMEKMVFLLGELWWKHLKISGHKDGASRGVLEKGRRHVFQKDLLIPKEKIALVGVSKDLTCLKINREDLISSEDPYEVVKRAYRKSVLRCHPDMGGDEKSFMKVYNSYKNILSWLKRPLYATRRGVPGHWCFEAGRSNWYSPL